MTVGGVHVEGIPASGGDVDHGIEGREEELGGVDVSSGRRSGRDRL